jgi:hypothetical protein
LTASGSIRTFSAVGTLVLGLAAAGAVEALSVGAGAVVGARQLAAVVLPVLRLALAETLLALSLARAVVLAQGCEERDRRGWQRGSRERQVVV